MLLSFLKKQRAEGCIEHTIIVKKKWKIYFHGSLYKHKKYLEEK